MDRAPAWLALRITIALVLLIGFYALALGLAFGLLWVNYALLVYGHRFSVKLAIVSVIACLAVLKATVFVSRPKFEPPGPELTEARHPRLFAAIREVSTAMGTNMPAAVYLVPEVNAFVAEVGGFWGFGRRRVMGIGLGLLHVDNVSQVKATLAHEFGHFVGGDTWLGAMVYRTRSSIGRMLEALGEGWLSKPFEWYGNLFLRVTYAVSRAQELAADRAAVSLAGTEAHVTGLEIEARSALLYSLFLRQEVGPLIELGHRPVNLFSGFAKYADELSARGALVDVDRMLQTSATTAYDSHPSLPDRLAYAKALPRVEVPVDRRPGISLLDELEREEIDVSRDFATRLGSVRSLSAVSWDEVCARVYAPRLSQDTSRCVEHVGRALGAPNEPAQVLSALIAALSSSNVTTVAALLMPELQPIAPAGQSVIATQQLGGILGQLLGAALIARGGQWRSEVGRPHEVELEGVRYDPFKLGADAVENPDKLAALAAQWQPAVASTSTEPARHSA